MLLVITIVGVGFGLMRERNRQAPVPPQAQQVSVQIIGSVRQMSYWFPGSSDELHQFYQTALSQQGWRYCATKHTPGCTNMVAFVEGTDATAKVYRPMDDRQGTGSTIEVWPIRTENGTTYVAVFET